MVRGTSARLNLLDFVAAMLLGFIGASAVFPPLRSVGNNAVLCLAAFVGWVLLAFVRYPRFFLRPTLYRLVVFGLSFYVTYVPYLFGNDTIGNRYVSLLFVTFGFVIYDYYEAFGLVRVLSRIVKMTIALAAITGLLTIRGLAQNPYLARSIKSSGVYSTSLSRQGIGGYEYVYFMVLIAVIAFYVVLESRVWRQRVIAALLYVLALAVVIYSNYLTALIVVVFGSAGVIVAHGMAARRGAFSVLVLPLLFGLLMLFGSQVASVAIRGVSNVSSAGLTALRLNAIQGSVVDGLRQEFMLDRAPVMMESIESALMHPVFGLSVTRIGVSGGYLTGFGQHSHILDTYALFGLIAGSAGMYVLFQPIFRRFSNVRLLGLSLPFGASYVLILVFNNAAPSLAVATCLMFPLAFRKFGLGSEPTRACPEEVQE